MPQAAAGLSPRGYSIRASTGGAALLIAINLATLAALTFLGYPFLAIAAVGIITLIGVLALADYVSVEPSVSTGEMRSALSASIVAVYLVVVALAATGGPLASTESAVAVIQNFTWVVGAVVIFYFGSKAVLQYAQLTRGGAPEEKPR